jgi:murein L,D-transpeptidase YcbB/YkuD
MSEDIESSRLTPDDKIPNERRSKPRRAEDRVRIKALQRRYAAYRRLALVAALAWAIVASAGSVALFLEGQHNADASQKAAAASAQAAAAATKAETATLRAQAATVKAQTATAEAVRAKQLTVALAHERYRSILENCRTQNKHYYDTRRKLYRIIKQLPPAERGRARASIKYSLSITSALQPKANCRAVANKQAGS